MGLTLIIYIIRVETVPVFCEFPKTYVINMAYKDGYCMTYIINGDLIVGMCMHKHLITSLRQRTSKCRQIISSAEPGVNKFRQ